MVFTFDSFALLFVTQVPLPLSLSLSSPPFERLILVIMVESVCGREPQSASVSLPMPAVQARAGSQEFTTHATATGHPSETYNGI